MRFFTVVASLLFTLLIVSSTGASWSFRLQNNPPWYVYYDVLNATQLPEDYEEFGQVSFHCGHIPVDASLLFTSSDKPHVIYAEANNGPFIINGGWNVDYCYYRSLNSLLANYPAVYPWTPAGVVVPWEESKFYVGEVHAKVSYVPTYGPIGIPFEQVGQAPAAFKIITWYGQAFILGYGPNPL
jgi:hypothetical protein